MKKQKVFLEITLATSEL